MKEQIKELFDDYQTNDWTIFELEKRVLNLFNVESTSECVHPWDKVDGGGAMAPAICTLCDKILAD